MLRIFAPNRRILAAMAAMTLVMSGCTSFRDYVHNGFKVGPNYSPPPGPVAGQWIESGKHPLLDQSEDLSRWWCVFADPTLNQLIAHSYRQNLTVKEAGFRIKEARHNWASPGAISSRKPRILRAVTRTRRARTPASPCSGRP